MTATTASMQAAIHFSSGVGSDAFWLKSIHSEGRPNICSCTDLGLQSLVCKLRTPPCLTRGSLENHFHLPSASSALFKVKVLMPQLASGPMDKILVTHSRGKHIPLPETTTWEYKLPCENTNSFLLCWGFQKFVQSVSNVKSILVRNILTKGWGVSFFRLRKNSTLHAHCLWVQGSSNGGGEGWVTFNWDDGRQPLLNHFQGSFPNTSWV